MTNKIWILVVGLLLLSGCTQSIRQVSKEIQTEVRGGLHRSVTLYSYSGQPIRKWEGENVIINGTEGGETEFMVGNKKVSVSGVFVIEEEQ